MFVQIQPTYGKDYKAGQIYFTYTIDSAISEGVTWFTCKDVSKIDELKKVSHCGIVLDENNGIAALAEKNAFTYQNLPELIRNPKTRIFFKEPKRLDELGVDFLFRTAIHYKDMKYNYRLATGFAVVNSWLGRKLLNEADKINLLEKFNKRNTLLCSQAVMQITYITHFHNDCNFLRTPYEVLCHKMFKEWK